VFDPVAHSFIPLAQTEIIPPETRYSSGIAAWQDYFSLIYNPSLGNAGLAEIVKRSRESGVMVGSTSFIVVENSAQWKMLERKQNQKLRNSVALEIEAVPEPSTLCLLAFGAGFLLLGLRKARRSKTAQNL
jgi:PEP-CTERM motif